ncbi:MAG: Phenylalanine-tRNA ligase beta subunit [candidate division TM6 bacterium GW2011_GWF2_32_72]|nr:MAG: Phenylalanine-tRNA ligase beta subunit [candidate division TM6 bacterium GW2011_GWF2_32_72]
MKLSISWIFDHIDASWKKVNIEKLVQKFNLTTAEIENFKKISIDSKIFSLVVLDQAKGAEGEMFCPEHNKFFHMPRRLDLDHRYAYMIKLVGNGAEWATAADFYCDKDFLLPAFYYQGTNFLEGGWKKDFEFEDYILEVDNKSLTNRPDMWGHRGFAREVAAILDLPLKPMKEFIAKKDIAEHVTKAAKNSKNQFGIKIEDYVACKRFAGLYIDHMEYRPSILWVAARLLKVDSKPIDAMVDLTNYVMQDLSQPMHAFDAAKLGADEILVRKAKKGEKLTILDGQKLELNEDDLVITNGKDPIALAGIMGGLHSGLSTKTKSIFLESACFDAGVIRRASAHHKIRTEASARFEKTLDPNQNVLAILRLLQILKDEEFDFKTATEISSLGENLRELKVKVDHSFLENKIGVELKPVFVKTILEKIGFDVVESKKDKDIAYTVTVPSFRCAKDITIKEDIAEEVARFFGYDNISAELPKKQDLPSSLQDVFATRKIKDHMAFALGMFEQNNYILLDTDFLNQIDWMPKKTVTLMHPASEKQTILTTDLLIYLFKNIETNYHNADRLRFFEIAKVWSEKGKKVLEENRLAGIMFDKKTVVDFYEAKAELCSLFELLGLEKVKWIKADKLNKPWFHEFQTAELFYDKKSIGFAGKVAPEFMLKIGEGDAFIFELDAEFLINFVPELKKYKIESKYQDSDLDISMFVPLNVTVDDVIEEIFSADKRIFDVKLVDRFEKPDWLDKKSLTFRFAMRDSKKTMERSEIEDVNKSVVKKLEKIGAQIR